jgi:hypothetical protein
MMLSAPNFSTKFFDTCSTFPEIKYFYNLSTNTKLQKKKICNYINLPRLLYVPCTNTTNLSVLSDGLKSINYILGTLFIKTHAFFRRVICFTFIKNVYTILYIV